MEGFMAKTSGVPFSGTKEQEAKLRARLAELKSVQGGLMPALQEVSERLRNSAGCTARKSATEAMRSLPLTTIST